MSSPAPERVRPGRPLAQFGDVARDLVPSGALLDRAAELAPQYQSAKPFPHIVLDGLWRPDVLEQIDAEFPSRLNRDWHDWSTDNEKKQTSKGISGLQPFSQLIFQLMNSSPFIDAMKAITGFDDLLPDPTFYGAGLHESFAGGWLDVHNDYINHRELPLARRINVLVYINHDWRPEWKGDLELWDAATGARAAGFAPVFNRTIIFNTTADALHGFPEPIACPPDRSRRLLSVYYWSADQSLLADAPDIAWIKTQKRKLAWTDFTPPVAVTAFRKLRGTR